MALCRIIGNHGEVFAVPENMYTNNFTLTGSSLLCSSSCVNIESGLKMQAV